MTKRMIFPSVQVTWTDWMGENELKFMGEGRVEVSLPGGFSVQRLEQERDGVGA